MSTNSKPCIDDACLLCVLYFRVDGAMGEMAKPCYALCLLSSFDDVDRPDVPW